VLTDGARGEGEDLSEVAKEENHGGLVRDILSTSKALDGAGQEKSTAKAPTVEALASKHQREVLQKEVHPLSPLSLLSLWPLLNE
jgi:hypothetical protein